MVRNGSDADSMLDRLFWIILIGVSLLRLALAGSFGLSVDESHYAMYAKKLAWGYFDHPPMVAFMGRATTFLADGPLLYRLGPVAAWFVSILILRRLIFEMYASRRLSLLSLLFLLAMPVQNLMGIALLPDAPLNFFWCASLLFAWRATQRGLWRDWILTGICCGGAFLSKYHGALLPMCLAGYVLSSPQRRRWALSFKPYVAGLVAMVVFIPNVIWNWRHEWVSYLYQLHHGGGNSEFKPVKVTEVIGGQMGAVSPVLFILICIAWFCLLRNRRRTAADSYMLWVSLPVFLFFCFIGMFGDILPHWPSIGLWGAAVCLASFSTRKSASGDDRFWFRWVVAGESVGLIFVALMYMAIAYPLVGETYGTVRSLSVKLSRNFESIEPLGPFKGKYDPSNDMYGWQKIAAKVERIRSEMPDPDRTFIFAHRFYTASQLGVYLEPDAVITSLAARGSQYKLWFDVSEHAGWDALFVDHDRYMQGVERYAGHFRTVCNEPEVIRIERRGNLAHEFHVYKCYGFRGPLQASRKEQR